MDKGWKFQIGKSLRLARLLTCGLLLGATLAACTSVSHPAPYATQGIESQGPMATPPWARMKTSWGKLEAIENWLQAPSSRRSQYWWAEGQLELSEGRVEFSREDLRHGQNSASVKRRLSKAHKGFTLVKTSPRATKLQRKRATRGLAQLDSLKRAPIQPSGLGQLIRRSTWGARPGKRDEMNTSGDRYTRITVHHSADTLTPNLDGSLGSSSDALRRLQRYHMTTEGYGDLGYHFMIDPTGRLFEGRELTWQGAHAGDFNKNKGNIGICLLGNFDTTRPTRAALRTLENTLGNLRTQYSISKQRVYGHQELKSTRCPGTHMMRWLKSYSGR